MSDLKRLQDLSELMLEAQRYVAEEEERLKNWKEKLAHIAEVELPDLMEELEVDSFAFKNGMKISLKETIRASISAKNAPEAMAWLIENGHDNIIKRSVVADLEKEQLTEDEEQLLAELREKFPVTDNRKVHPQTLAAFVREMLEEGREIPMETFGVHRQRLAKVDPAK